MKRVWQSWVVLLLCGFIGAIQAQTLATSQLSTDGASTQLIPLRLTVGKSRLLDFKGPAVRLSIGDPAVADVMLVNSQEIYLLGKKTGSTNVMLWHADHHMTALEVVVGLDTDALQLTLSSLLPTEKNFRVLATGNAITLAGQMSDAVKIQQAVQVAEEFSGKKVINLLTMDFLPQVLVEVKIAEVQKDLSESLGLNLSSSRFAFNPLGGAAVGTAASTAASSATVAGSFGANSNAWLQAQVANGAATILAEPNIMAISGQEGRFLAGGKVYLPIPQSVAVGGGSAITLQEQQYGIALRFTPTVLDGGRINLKISPEVSELSTQGVQASAGQTTAVMPTIVTRQASTTVQLYDGQSLAIGGLIKQNVVETISAFPGLANLPVLGALFRSSSYTTGRTELLIIVTPHIVEPLNSMPELPTAKFKPPTEKELFLDGQLESGRSSAQSRGGLQ